MDHAMHHDHEDGAALTKTAISATLHCLTGCAIGEVLGMALAAAWGWGDAASIGLAIALAFFFGYALASIPLLRAGLPVRRVIALALAADTVSILTMEIIDDGIMLSIPGAMNTGLGDLGFWAALAAALFIAFWITVPVNRWLISRGKGHAVVDAYH